MNTPQEETGPDRQAGDAPGARAEAIVAVGASAGGLEPLEAFFQDAPVDRGWAYVVIQHLSPDYRSVMDELLGRKSDLTIRHIEPGMALERDTVYLNQPNTMARLEAGAFAVEPYADGDALPHLPIDAFLRSLAEAPHARRAAVVMSGSGADGAKGAEALHKAGGHVLVQTPKEAKFSSMPRAVLATGAVDRIEEAARLPMAVAELFKQDRPAGRPRPAPSDPWKAILHRIEVQHRIDFSAYKAPTVMRRIERRMQLKGIANVAAYRDLLEADEDAVDELYQDMLIGVTEFYRDPDAMASVARNAIRPLVAQADEDDLRVWVPGCASGEEAYTLGIELSEAARAEGREPAFRIIATDVHRPSVEHAAAGIYARDALRNVLPDLRERYFVEHRDGLQVDSGLRQRIIFSAHNAIADPPFMRLDLVSCRNLLIYLDEAAQARLISMFLFGLKKGGYLFLGASESLGELKSEFATIDSSWRLFQKTSDRRVIDPAMLAERIGAPRDVERFTEKTVARPRPPLTSLETEGRSRRDRDSLLRGYDALLKRYAPSSILITDAGEVLTWFGAASAYIDTLSELADRTVEEIVHPSLRYAINLGTERLRVGAERTFERQVRVEDEGGEGGGHLLTVRVEPLIGGAQTARFLLVTLVRGGAEAPADGDTLAAGRPEVGPDDDQDILVRRVRELERDLRLTDESLQYVTERLETSGEELQASNEELHASNEEMQASNEELQASNEELHAVNEELVSVSAEHERKIDLLSELNHDLELVVTELGLGIVILDRALVIRRFTRRCADLLRFAVHDVGRPFAEVGAKPPFADPVALAEEALGTGRRQRARGDWDGRAISLEAIPPSGADTPLLLVFRFAGDDDEVAAERAE